jgi:EAL domain-containing protein (putative c-di-GMP-specific phosphodiesterase class I)/GGDEF domain-containing protein
MYLIDYDITAVILSAITIYLFYSKKKMPDDTNRRYQDYAWSIVVAELFSLASSICLNSPDIVPRPLTLALLTAFFAAQRTVPFLMARYLLGNAKRHPYSWIARALFLAPWLASMALISLNPFNGLLFVLRPSGAFLRTPFMLIVYYCSFAYLAVSVWATFSRKSGLPGRKKAYIAIALFAPVLFSVLSNVFPRLKLEGFASSLSALFVLLTLQNSKEFVDGRTGFFNHDAFIRIVDDSLVKKKEFTLLLSYSGEFANLSAITDMRTQGEIANMIFRWLSRTIGNSFQVFNLDGGRFAVLREKTRADDPIGDLALKIVERSRHPWSHGSVQLRLDFKIAILQCPKDASSVNDLQDYLDQLTGLSVQVSDRHLFFASDFIPNKHKRDVLVARALSAALADKRLDLRFQPIYSLRDGQVIMFEVQLELGISNIETAYQDEILKMADQLGRGHELEALILNQAFAWRPAAGPRWSGMLQIRLEPSACVEQDWPDMILRIAERHGKRLSDICLEISETTAANASAELIRDMETLSARGVVFALDEFGSGYNDFSKMLIMPFAFVKLDRNVVHACLKDEKGYQLLAGTISLFKRQGISVIIEGIETVEQSDWMTRMSCDYVQGFEAAALAQGGAALELLEELPQS